MQPNTFEFNKPLKKIETSIPGLLIFDLTVLGDNRGWFKENWQLEKMLAAGLPDFGPVQNNISYNAKRGTIRGIHAEPWDKLITTASGRSFGAWVDIREGSPTFGETFTTEINPSVAIFVPSGVANSYLTLEDDTVYSYLVNDHWSADGQYSFVSALDESLGIDWPIPPSEWEMSEKDKNHPLLKDTAPVKPKKILVTGANGQVGMALKKVFPNAEFVDREQFDITDLESYKKFRWRDYQAVINAAAYTAVDAAEDERATAWAVNATAVSHLARVANEYNLTLVHFSTDYVFDGSKEVHLEDEPLSPLNSTYSASKTAGDIAAMTAKKHYLLRVSWVIGEGNNFVRTMQSLAEKGVKPAVVADQIGRLTFANDIANGVKHLIETEATYGTYNLSNEGKPASWAEVAREVYELSGKHRDDISDTTTAEYFKDKLAAAPRPLQSTLSLDKLKASGFTPRDWREALREYLEN